MKTISRPASIYVFAPLLACGGGGAAVEPLHPGGVIFDDIAPALGNIPGTSAAQRLSRTFSSAGDYDYHNSRDSDIKGRIRVR